MARDKRERTPALRFLHFNCVIAVFFLCSKYRSTRNEAKAVTFFLEPNAGFLISHGHCNDKSKNVTIVVV